MMNKGTELETFITGLNGDATIDTTLMDVLVSTALTILEEERPWMARRKLDTSLSLTTANTWQTAQSLAGITDFSKFNDDAVITLYASNGSLHYYYQIPADRRLEFKDDNSAFWYDVNSGNVYFGGTPPFAGTLYIPYISTSPAIDLESATVITDPFLKRALPVLGFYAIGIHKGAIDYDAINKLMLPSNQAALTAAKSAMEKWDDAQQLSEVRHNDPTDNHGPRAGHVDRS